MAKLMLSADRLAARLAPYSFWLRDNGIATHTISFVRPSTIPRLFEHVNVYSQGKKGEAVYATTVVSGSTNCLSDECISERDLTLLYKLETDKERHWTLMRDKREAEIWEERLAQVADSQCRVTSESKGPALRERLEPAFAAVDRYVMKIGNLHDIFALEYRYFQDAPAEKRIEAERLASLIGDIFESREDVELACLVVLMFASEVESRADAFLGTKWHEDADFRARIYLLIDIIREQRKMWRG
jgi:hypothetical protein